MHVLKMCVVIPVYLFLVLECFVGGGGGTKKDCWDDMMKWVRK